MKKRMRVLVILAVPFVVCALYVVIYSLDDVLHVSLLSWVRTTALEKKMIQVGQAIEHYRNATGGRIPTMAELMQGDSPLLPPGQDQRPYDAFQIVPLPMCVAEDGTTRDAYVLYAKLPPRVRDWGLIIVDGKQVHVR